jgi:L-ribulose-5-phosphate 4-epimerase
MDSLDLLREEVTRVARRAYLLRLQTGDGGNLSARVPGSGQIVIKPSGVSFDDCGPDDLVTVSLDGQQLAGSGRPSREIRTHLAIYRARSDITGIFHCHSPWAVAAGALGAELPLHTYHARSKLGRVPVLAIDGEATPEVAAAAGALVAGEPALKAFVQARHGIFSFAPSLLAAFHQAELVEETAKLAWLTAVAGSRGDRPLAGTDIASSSF